MSVNLSRYMKVLINIFLLFIPIIVQAKNIIIESNKPIKTQFSTSNCTYLIRNIIDLKGDTLKIPVNSIIKFSGNGKLVNGAVLGDFSKIDSQRKIILNDVIILGTWRNKIVYSDWVNFPQDSTASNQSFQNLMTLCKGNLFTNFYMSEGNYYVSSSYRSAPIIVPSNVYWHNKAVIKMIPNDLDWYNMVLLDKSDNVTIDGGTFIGDVLSHKGNTGEWGHGIKCGGASNVTLKNLTCINHWGDGIDLIEGKDDNGIANINCKNINISNVKCLYNRRQGMSIEAAHNVLIKNSEFAFTGNLKYTAPGAGMDIEPWANNDHKVKNIKFINCSMHDNTGLDFQCEPNIQEKGNNNTFVNDIKLENCSIGNARVQFTNCIILRNCNFTDRLILRNTQNIEIIDSKANLFEEGPKVIDFKNKNSKLNSAISANLILSGGIITSIALLSYSIYTQLHSSRKNTA